MSVFAGIKNYLLLGLYIFINFCVMILQVAMFPGFIFICVYILTYIKNNAV